jgi:hypothetical protein
VWLLEALLLPVGLGCSSPKGTLTPRPSLLDSARPLGAHEAAAEWRYHPRKPARLARSYAVDPSTTLFVGALGERWLGRSGNVGSLPASSLAPEALVGAITRDNSWFFVGESGTTYEAASPLGPFLGASAPLEPLARVDSGLNHVLGVSRDAKLVSSEDAGLSWHPVGPPNLRFGDVLVVPPHALALSIPEQLWWSRDEGQRWQPIDAEPFGAERLIRDAEGSPVVTSVIGARRLILGAAAADAPQLVSLGRVPRPEQPELASRPLDGPSAKAIGMGRAFLGSRGYFEVDLGVRAAGLVGALGAPLARHPLPVFAACQEIRVAGFGSSVYAACTRERTGATRRFEFFESEDGGQTFERAPYSARGDPDRLELAVGIGGVLLATGLCNRQEDLAGCRPRGVQVRRSSGADAGVGFELSPVPAPALEDTALALAFSADGRTAYAIGQRTKGDSLFVFVSDDLTRGFTARPVGRLDEGGASGPARVLGFDAADDGHLSLVLAQPAGTNRLVILDAAGTTLAASTAPLPSAAIGAYGTRALAISPDEAWESLDGGAHWDSLGRPPGALCEGSGNRCSVAVHCHDSGCAVGESFSRLGWRGQTPDAAALLPPMAGKASAPRRSLGSAFSCELANTEWAELDGVERLPDASQAALGKTAWFAMSTRDATAAVGIWLAEFPRATTDRLPTLRYSDLLMPSERSSEMAYYASIQVEGVAALRYRVPTSQLASAARLSNVEVAWENLLEGRRGRSVIADAGEILPGDFTKGDGAVRRAQPDLLSIASGGIYVRLHRQPQHQQPSYYLDGSTVETIPPLTLTPAPPKGTNFEMARLGHQNVSLFFVNQGATVVRARRKEERWTFDAMTAAFVDPESFDVRQGRDITYLGGQAGIHLTTESDSGSEGALFPLQSEGPVLGPPVAVPTQASLAASLRACTPRERSDTPRIVAPIHPGGRHPLFVHDSIEPLRILLSESAVLHGTPDAACVEMLDAEPVRLAAAPSAAKERALLALNGPSFLFRVAPDNPRREVRVEYRTMRCRPDAGAEAPPEIYELPGTHSGE